MIRLHFLFELKCLKEKTYILKRQSEILSSSQMHSDMSSFYSDLESIVSKYNYFENLKKYVYQIKYTTDETNAAKTLCQMNDPKQDDKREISKPSIEIKDGLWEMKFPEDYEEELYNSSDDSDYIPNEEYDNDDLDDDDHEDEDEDEDEDDDDDDDDDDGEYMLNDESDDDDDEHDDHDDDEKYIVNENSEDDDKIGGKKKKRREGQANVYIDDQNIFNNEKSKTNVIKESKTTKKYKKKCIISSDSDEN